MFGFPSFIYVKPKSEGRVGTKFQENRVYDSVRSWMIKLVTMNGGVYLDESDEDPKFDLEDDDSTFEEQIILDDFNNDEK